MEPLIDGSQVFCILHSSWSKAKRQVSLVTYPFIHTVLYTSVMTTLLDILLQENIDSSVYQD